MKWINSLRPRENYCHFTDDIFRYIYFDENAWILLNFSLKLVPKGTIDNISALVQIMAWRQPGTKPLSEPIMVRLLTHICITQPQWVNSLWIVVTIQNPSYGSNLDQVMAYCLRYDWLQSNMLWPFFMTLYNKTHKICMLAFNPDLLIQSFQEVQSVCSHILHQDGIHSGWSLGTRLFHSLIAHTL